MFKINKRISTFFLLVELHFYIDKTNSFKEYEYFINIIKKSIIKYFNSI